MTKTEYLNERNGLLIKAKAFADDNDAEGFAKVKAEIESLDEGFRTEAIANANNMALEGLNASINLADVTKNVNGGIVMASTLETKVENAPTYETAFANKLMGVPLSAEEQELFNDANAKFSNTMTTSTNAFLVPQTIKEGIYEVIKEKSSIFADCNPTYVEGDLTIAIESTGIDDAAITTEGAADGTLNSKDAGLTYITLRGFEIVRAVNVSYKLKKMSPDAFIAYIIRKLGEACARCVAKYIVNGTGSDEPLGIVTALANESDTPQVVECSATNVFNYKALTTAMSKITGGYANGACIYANNATIWGSIANITDSIGRPLFIPNPAAGGIGKVLGLTVKEEAYVPKDTVLIGNVGDGFAININESITIEEENHAKERSTDYVATMVYDGRPVTTKAFALITGADNLAVATTAEA